MKRYYSLLAFMMVSYSLPAQLQKGLFDLLAESDYVVLGDVIQIDTLRPEVHPYYQLECNSAEIRVEKLFKGMLNGEAISLFYYTTKFEHVPSVNPQIHERYLLFLTYDEARHSYVLPSMGHSIAEVSPSNEDIVVEIIDELIGNRVKDRCKYFDLLMTNSEEPINLVNSELDLMSWRHTISCSDSLDAWYCIDSLDKVYIFNTFKKTKNLKLTPFICNTYSTEITKFLGHEISKQLILIGDSDDSDFFDEGFIVVAWLEELSYLKSTGWQEIRDLSDLVIWSERQLFIEKAKEILEQFLTHEKR